MSATPTICALCGRTVEGSSGTFHQHEGFGVHAHCPNCLRIERRLFLLEAGADPRIHLLVHEDSPHITTLPDGSNLRLEASADKRPVDFLCWRCHSAINDEMVVVSEEGQASVSEMRFHRPCFVALLNERLESLERRGLRREA